MRVSVAGIVLATVLGTLDRHRAARRTTGSCARSCTVYVEVVRNIPLLLFADLRQPRHRARRCCRGSRDAWEPLGVAVFSNRGHRRAVVRAAPAGAARRSGSSSASSARGSSPCGDGRSSDRTGAPARSGLWALGVVRRRRGRRLAGSCSATTSRCPRSTARDRRRHAPRPVVLRAALRARDLHREPHRRDRPRVDPGGAPGPGRGGQALALSGFQRMWFVVLPQAFRIALPPIGNQYLNLIKNSSLGAAISYFELTNVTQIAVAQQLAGGARLHADAGRSTSCISLSSRAARQHLEPPAGAGDTMRRCRAAVAARGATWLRRNLFRTWLDASSRSCSAASRSTSLYRPLRFVFVTGRWEIVEVNLSCSWSGGSPTTSCCESPSPLVVLALWGGLIAGLVRARQRARRRVVARRSPLAAPARATWSSRFWPPLAVGLAPARACRPRRPVDHRGRRRRRRRSSAGSSAAVGCGRLRLGRRPWRWCSSLRPRGRAVVLYADARRRRRVGRVGRVHAQRLHRRWRRSCCASRSACCSRSAGGRSCRCCKAMCTSYIEVVPRLAAVRPAAARQQRARVLRPAVARAGSWSTRAIVVFTLFTAAYIAEIVRGGLQSVPPGQYEAAKALGLSPARRRS